ncbi:MAG: LysR family transcriptional regulator [Lachnospiraceae bacterium]|nr:LysR family transcriptional regulator [Lachnospiraceae bacterium]
MHLNQLRYFVSVAATRSFTKAAEIHFMTQTAVTQQIKALEARLGFELFDRSKRPIELTPAGKVFYKEAKTILMRVDMAVEKAREAMIGTTGTLRIGFEKGYERSNLSDALRKFHKMYPSILFTCLRKDTDSLAKFLLNDELDVIFGWDSMNLRENERIGYKLEYRSGLCVALYDHHPYASMPSLTRADLRDETILYMSPASEGNSFGDAHFLNLYKKAGYKPNILLKSSDVESILMMVASEVGISILPTYSVEKLANADNLVFVPLEGEDEYEDIHMFWDKHSENAALACFLEFMGV